MPTNAVYGFTTMLRKLLKEEKPRWLAVAFDLSGPTFRHDRYEGYKAHREPPPDDLNVQVPVAKDVCRALRIPLLELPGYEADDLIATYTRLGREAGFSVVVVASDKDLLQLVGDGVTVLHPVRNVRLDPAGVTEAFGVPPERVRDVLGLMGDSVDNIPGVPGVGEKTALAMVRTYGDLDAVVARAERFGAAWDARDALVAALAAAEAEPVLSDAHAEAACAAAERLAEALRTLCLEEADPEACARLTEVGRVLAASGALDLRGRAGSPCKQALQGLKELRKALAGMDKGSGRRVWAAVREHAQAARLSRELATLDAHVPVDVPPEALEAAPPDRARVHELFASLEFKQLAAEYAGAVTEGAESEEAPSCRGGGGGTGGRGLDHRQRVRAGSPGRGSPRRGRAVPRGELAGPGSETGKPGGTGPGREARARFLGPRWGRACRSRRSSRRSAVCWPTPACARSATAPRTPCTCSTGSGFRSRRGGSTWSWPASSSTPTTAGTSPTPLAERWLGAPPRAPEPERGPRQLSFEPSPEAVPHAARDAATSLRLAPALEDLLEREGLAALYRDVEAPLLPLLARMETHGIRVEPQLLAGMSGVMETRARGSAAPRSTRWPATAFNVDSPKQLREVLFDASGPGPASARRPRAAVTPPMPRRSTSWPRSTRSRGKVLEYRELAKLKGTYVDALPLLVDPRRPDACTRRTTPPGPPRVACRPRIRTFRTSPCAPRRAGASAPRSCPSRAGSSWPRTTRRSSCACWRTCAGTRSSSRPSAPGRTSTASPRRGFSAWPPESVTDEMRQRAKAVNFGILYGMSETRLAREQGISRAEARALHPGLLRALRRACETTSSARAPQAVRDGLVRTAVRSVAPLSSAAGRGPAAPRSSRPARRREHDRSRGRPRTS